MKVIKDVKGVYCAKWIKLYYGWDDPDLPHARQRQMILSPNRHDEVMYPVHLAIDQQLSDHHSVVCRPSKRPGPPNI